MILIYMKVQLMNKVIIIFSYIKNYSDKGL